MCTMCTTDALWTLGHNLRIAAALCRAFRLGHRYGDDMWELTNAGIYNPAAFTFHPGCGYGAP
jgi:hypothetical protein